MKPNENNTTAIPNSALPSFFKGVEIVGNAADEAKKMKRSNGPLKTENIECELKVDQPPMLITNHKIKDIYVKNNFAYIKRLETLARKDLDPIYNNISTKGASAWTKVRKDGKEFYLAWSQGGSMWAYATDTKEIRSSDNETTYQQTVQIGTYSGSSGVLGMQKYKFQTPVLVGEIILSYIIARALSQIVADGLGFLVANLAVYVCRAAAELGFASFSCTIPTALLSGVATCLIFTVVFIGLTYLWQRLNRKYTIRLQVFNWDEDHEWKAIQEVRSNAKIAGGSGKEVSFTLPKYVPSGSDVCPPGFDPVEILDSVCYYAVVVWENDNTFMEGCSMALKMQMGDTNEGFMWAFDCPRFSDNQHAGDNGMQDAKTYLKNCKWNKKPKGFEIVSGNVPVSFALDALSGASDNLYNINIHINQRLQQS